MGEIDPTLVQELQHQPKPTIMEPEDVPLIDLSPLINMSPSEYDPKAIKDLVAEVRDACIRGGFFKVFNHGVPMDSRENLMSMAKRFFDQPLEEKRMVMRDEVNLFGYHDSEHTQNVKDLKEVIEIPVEVPTLMCASHEPDDNRITEYITRWPRHPSGFREAYEEYVKDVQQLSNKLFELISLSLNLPANRLKSFFCKDQTSFIKISHYPPRPSPGLELGVGPHKDSYALTILAQDDVGGLQVKRKTDGEWISVKPTPNTFIINVGDIMQVWSNDAYESVEHRVILNSSKDRFSIAFFPCPSYYTTLEPLVELTNEGNPAKYKSYNWGKYYATKRLSNFKQLATGNIKIDHFKIPVE